MSLKSKSSKYLAKSSKTFIFPYTHPFHQLPIFLKQNKKTLKYSIYVSKLAEGFTQL